MARTSGVNAAIMIALLAGLPASTEGASISARALRVSVASESRIKAHALLSTEFGSELRTETEEGVEFLDGKPIRVARSGKKREDKGGKLNYKDTHVGTMQCGETLKVNSASDKTETCPDACPFYAQDKTDDAFCTFRCVTEDKCAEMNPHTPIGDEERGICRSCIVEFCSECDKTVTTDKCAKCQSGYELKDGLCYWKYWGTLKIVLIVIGLVLLPIVLWVVDMCIRPTSNDVGLKNGLEFREAQKLRMAKDPATGRRELWPINTNLCRELVAGPGMILHFNFQAALVVWAAIIALLWLTLSLTVDSNLLILGTRRFGSPRENCILVAWGYEKQKELMWVKVLFCVLAYVISVVMHLGHCVRQLRMFQAIDYDNKTFKDYVAMIEDLPQLKGDTPAEETIKAAIAEKSGIPADKIVGVSIAWDYQEKEDEVTKALHKDLDELDGEQPKLTSGEAIYTSLPRSQLWKWENAIFAEEEEENQADAEGGLTPRTEINNALTEMYASPNAFVVFDTEDIRDQAVEALKDGFKVVPDQEKACTIGTLECEPDTVQWVNFGHSSTGAKVLRLCVGFGAILVACLVWAVVFYAPYAWYVMNFNYENGREPGFEVSFSFSMIVVIGNAIMYEVCARISDNVGFRFRDDREACYMILYTIACMFNVALDFVTTYYTAYLVMTGLGFRNYFGKKLEDIDVFTEQFETYGMQRSLAENTFGYAFPSTFLIPFLIEPFVTIGLPLYIGILVVRSHPEIQGRAAEEWVASIPLDMGRYADLILNVILGLLIFYFPGGYTTTLFAGMAASHIYIYAFDHWKILRNIPSCVIASMDIDWWSQALLIPCIAIIASVITFKYNCIPGLENRLMGMPLILACCAAFFGHCIVHGLLLVKVVPLFGKAKPEEEGPEVTFAELAHTRACSWFTANPIHCLRSAHFYKHSPACQPFHLGKEYHMKVNKAIGCYFEEEQPPKKAVE